LQRTHEVADQRDRCDQGSQVVVSSTPGPTATIGFLSLSIERVDSHSDPGDAGGYPSFVAMAGFTTP
jgi:hypothetical protein